MAAELITLDIRTGQQWRSWLRKHHAASPGVWLVFHKDHTGVKSVPYEEAVRQALCFGWIDSLIKRLDDDRYARKFTPRKPTSKWSDINRKRWAELKGPACLRRPVSLRRQPATGMRRVLRSPSCRPTSPKPSRPIRKRGGSFRRWRRPTGVTSWFGFIRPSDRKRAKTAFANRSRCWRPEKSSA